MEKGRVRTARPSFLLHLHPRRVPEETIRFSLSLGLGGMAATLCLALTFTGVFQLLSYVPRMDGAYESVLQMYDQGNLAGFMRNIHYWSGNLLVIVCFLHMLRVFLTGALTGRRGINWVVGVLVFGLVLGANFTGYLLPNDQLAYWAVTIFTSMLSYVPLCGSWLVTTLRGGVDVGPVTLTNFFAIHVGILPVLLWLLLVYHFWLIRKAGGLIQRPQGEGPIKMVDAMPHLVFREFAVGLTLLSLLAVFSAIFDAPLGEPATPGNSPNPVKAAWYFMGLQELLLHLHPAFVTCLIPVLTFCVLASIPYINNAVLPGGVWFGGTRGHHVAAWSLVIGAACTTITVCIDSMLSLNSTMPDHPWLTRGVLPLLVYGALLTGWYAFFRRYTGCSRAEGTMAVMVFLTGTIVSLTIIGCWFRGEGMALVVPFLE
ncbi:cytochrome b N-terminal domain-containing protein [Desulfopila aestuarii]|uniref:Cytochrome b subunit of the bc complex n=1 Tax=Desulfopila aestuarii DSM 18488 TaxID=1121416 RepID=A0A1M7YF79_9BACT|nr:cytochrome b N-terminal domain-containing protein [Desulfopila aestuarii]SHO51273.1 Cytochrome b subunit of the bc complex [Desulfopila aestuarii DSM 18488]